MANLLEEASILLTPTAYNNGSMLAVKPSEDLLGPELVANGDFSTDSVWAKDANWSIANGKATSTGGGRMFQSIPFLETNIGSKVVVSFDIVDYTSGGVVIQCYGSSSETFTGVGTHTFTTVTTNTLNFYINNSGQGNLVGSIDNVSVKVDLSGDFIFTRNSAATRVNAQGLVENVQILSSDLVSNGDFSQEGAELVTNGDFATDSDWNLRNAWVISNGICSLTSPNSDYLSQSNVLTANRFYKLTFDIVVNSGSLQPQFFDSGFQTIGTYTTTQSVEVYFLSSSSGTFYFKPNSFDGSIDNVSVKEVGQDWILGPGVIIADNKLTKYDPSVGNTSASQSGVFTVGKTYKYKLVVSGDLTASDKVVGFVTDFTSAGTYEGYWTANSTSLVFSLRGSTNVYSINSVSVKEITDDTNLPRINYEGFSYQDVLGSEQVLNASFSDGLNNWNSGGGATLSVSNNQLTIEADNDFNFYARQSVQGFEVGKKYKIEIDVVGGVTSKMQVNFYGEGSVIDNQPIVIGKQSVIVTVTNGVDGGRFIDISNRNDDGLNDSLIIESVSVKEYLGQEVVPDSGCGSWLLEPQSTNTYNYSEPISNDGPSSNIAYESFDWGIGFSNCIKFGSNDQFRYRYGGSVQDATEYTISAFVIMDDLSEPILDTGGYSGDFKFVLGGLIGGVANENVYYGNNVYRVSATMTSGSSSGNSGPIKYPSQSSKGFRITGIQIEQGLFPTSYIPTNGAASTRLRDLSGNSGNTSLINSTEGVLYFEGKMMENAPVSFVSISDGTGSVNNNLNIRFTPSTNTVWWRVQVGGSASVSLIVGLSDMFSNTKLALKWKENDFSLWENGNKISFDTSGSVFPLNTLNTIDLHEANGLSSFNSELKAIAVFKTALTDEQLTALTTI